MLSEVVDGFSVVCRAYIVLEIGVTTVMVFEQPFIEYWWHWIFWMKWTRTRVPSKRNILFWFLTDAYDFRIATEYTLSHLKLGYFKNAHVKHFPVFADPIWHYTFRYSTCMIWVCVCVTWYAGSIENGENPTIAIFLNFPLIQSRRNKRRRGLRESKWAEHTSYSSTEFSFYRTICQIPSISRLKDFPFIHMSWVFRVVELSSAPIIAQNALSTPSNSWLSDSPNHSRQTVLFKRDINRRSLNHQHTISTHNHRMCPKTNYECKHSHGCIYILHNIVWKVGLAFVCQFSTLNTHSRRMFTSFDYGLSVEVFVRSRIIVCVSLQWKHRKRCKPTNTQWMKQAHIAHTNVVCLLPALNNRQIVLPSTQFVFVCIYVRLSTHRTEWTVWNRV